MRKTLAQVLIGTGFVGGFVTAAYYVYWMWEQDWGPMGTRGHNLMFVLMLFGSIVVFLAVLAAFGMIAVSVDKDLGK